MARILLAWEYGEGFGHVALLLPLAKALKAAGHEVLMCLKDPISTRPMWENSGVTIAHAPFIPVDPNYDRDAVPDTLADAMCVAGYDAPEKILALGQNWNRILLEWKPDLVIAEFAPTFALCTIGRTPTLTLGSGCYTMPVIGRSLPNLRFWQNRPLKEQSIRNEARMLAGFNAARQAFGLPPLAFFSDAFGGDAHFVCYWPELDGYAPYRAQPAIGPIVPPRHLPPLYPYPAEPPLLVAYLAGGTPHTANWVEGIKASGYPAIAYLRGASDAEKSALASPEFTIMETPMDFYSILPNKALLIHHGGMSTCDTAMHLGVPQMLLTRHLEQKINAACLYHRGVAELHYSFHFHEPARLTQLIKQMIETPRYRQAAQSMAETLRTRLESQPKALDIIMNACDRLLAEATSAAAHSKRT